MVRLVHSKGTQNDDDYDYTRNMRLLMPEVFCLATEDVHKKKESNNNNALAIQNKSNMAGREDAAQFYLTKHRINDLFHNITASIVFDRPGLYLSQHHVLFKQTRLQLTA